MTAPHEVEKHELERGVTRLAKLDVDALLTELRQRGIETFVLPGAGITDCESFFEAVRATLPLNPPIRRAGSWDALGDSLWQGLYELDGSRVVILWPSAQTMADGDPAEFDLALKVFGQVATSIADAKLTVGRPKELSILVE